MGWSQEMGVRHDNHEFKLRARLRRAACAGGFKRHWFDLRAVCRWVLGRGVVDRVINDRFGNRLVCLAKGGMMGWSPPVTNGIKCAMMEKA